MSTTQPEPKTEPPDPTARHLRLCQRIAELGMALLEAAAEKAHAALHAPPAQDGAPPPSARTETLDFVRLSRNIQQVMALEARLAAGPARDKTRLKPALSDPRRAPLRRGLHIATEFLPDRAALRRELDTNLDEKLTEDPGHEQAIYNLFMALCGDAGIKPDLGKIPDECLGFNIPTAAQIAETESSPPEIDLHSEEYLSYLRTGYPVPDFSNKAGAFAHVKPDWAKGPGPKSQ